MSATPFHTKAHGVARLGLVLGSEVLSLPYLFREPKQAFVVCTSTRMQSVCLYMVQGIGYFGPRFLTEPAVNRRVRGAWRGGPRA